MDINKKDIIRINQEIGANGSLSNESSLEYAIGALKSKPSWLKDLAQFTRALCVDHAFQDGNKRTALAIILVYLEEKGLEANKEKLVNIVYKISKENINDLNKIMRLIKNGIF